MTRRSFLLASAAGCALSLVPSVFSRASELFAITHTDDEWRKLLTPDQFAILRQSATERPFTSPLLHEKRPGTFGCAGCRRDLFLRARNSTAAPAGRASGSHWRARSERSRTRLSAWCGLPFTAAAAVATLAMSSMTAHAPPDCAIASTGSPWSSHRKSRDRFDLGGDWKPWSGSPAVACAATSDLWRRDFHTGSAFVIVSTAASITGRCSTLPRCSPRMR